MNPLLKGLCFVSGNLLNNGSVLTYLTAFTLTSFFATSTEIMLESVKNHIPY